MPFDNAKFTAWMVDFEKYLRESGLAEPQVLKYRREHYNEAVAHYAAGTSAGDAAMRELLG